jgi:hypothetical protein
LTLAEALAVILAAELVLGAGAYAYRRVHDAYRYELRRTPNARCEPIERRELGRLLPVMTDAYEYFLSLPQTFECAEWSC